MTNKSSNVTAATFARVFHHVDAELHSVAGEQFIRHALLRTFTEAMTVDESAVAAFSVLQVELASTHTHTDTQQPPVLNCYMSLFKPLTAVRQQQ